MKSFVLAALVALSMIAAPSALAETRAASLNAEFLLNQASPQAMADAQLGSRIIRSVGHSAILRYDFAKQGGAIGAITLQNSAGKPFILPRGAVIRDCVIDVITPFVGSSTTVALGTGQSTTDLKGATAIASYTGLVACVPVGTAATAFKLTADRTAVMTVAVGALTAGKINVIVNYDLSD